MFIQTESTPNPQTLKFLPGRPVLGVGGREFDAVDAARSASPLAAAILEVEGLRRVYLGPDFLTATKVESVDWAHLKPAILAAIMDHFVAERPVLLDDAPQEESASAVVYEGEAGEIVAQLRDLIETRIRPAVARDGGDIVFHSWDHEEGVVRLSMRGACAGCPSSAMTLKQGIENMLRHYVPEVNRVEQAI